MSRFPCDTAVERLFRGGRRITAQLTPTGIQDIDGPMSQLAERFQESRGAPVEWQGHTVHMIYETSVAADEALRIEFTEPSPARPQALRLRARNGQLEVDGQLLDDVVLWSDSSPSTVVAAAHPREGKKAVSVRVWNAWRDPVGTMQAWIGNAGMLVDEDSEGVVWLRCSDGFDDPTFADLVATVQIVGGA